VQNLAIDCEWVVDVRATIDTNDTAVKNLCRNKHYNNITPTLLQQFFH
jgi:hypothetical protein